MRLGLLGYTQGSVFNRTSKKGIYSPINEDNLGLTANKKSVSSITRKSGIYRPEINGTKMYYKGDIQSFYSIVKSNVTYTSNKPQGLDDRPNGSRFLYVVNGGGDIFGTTQDVRQISLTTSENLGGGGTGATRLLHWVGNNISKYPNLQSMRFKSDGTKLFGIGTLRSFSGSSIYYGSVMFIYPISPAFTLSSAFLTDSSTFPEVYYFNGEENFYYSFQVGSYGVDDPNDTRGISPNGYRIKESFINPDGLIFYYLIGNVIYQGSLSSAWSLSSVSLNQASLNVSDNTINSFTFNNDGTKLFTFATSNNRIQQYNLGTAWQISSASISNSLDLQNVIGGDLRIGIRMLSSQSTIICLSRTNNYGGIADPTSNSFLHEINQALY